MRAEKVKFLLTAFSFVADLLLLPTFVEPIVLVAWSLQHEMLFYVLFAVLIWQPALMCIHVILRRSGKRNIRGKVAGRSQDRQGDGRQAGQVRY